MFPKKSGSIFLVDSVCSGNGMKGFIKFLKSWCKDDNIEIENRLRIINFADEKFTKDDKNNREIFPNISFTSIILPSKAWNDFSFNEFPLRLSFPPPLGLER